MSSTTTNHDDARRYREAAAILFSRGALADAYARRAEERHGVLSEPSRWYASVAALLMDRASSLTHEARRVERRKRTQTQPYCLRGVS